MNSLRYFHQPTISESLGNGWYTLKRYFLLLFLVVIIQGILGSLFSFSAKSEELGAAMLFLMPLGVAYNLFFLSVINYGSSLIFLQSIRDVKPDLQLLFVGFQRNYLNIVLASLVTTIIVVIGLVVCVIPGIVLACRLAFVPYLVMDRGLDAMKAIEESWRLTRRHGWTIFGFGLMSICIVIGGLLCFIVGIFPAIVWIGASFASFYQSVVFDEENAAMPNADQFIQA